MGLKRRRRLFRNGCILPLLAMAVLYTIWMFWNWRVTYYIQDLDLYVQITRIPFRNVRMSFSDDGKFGNDFIDYNNTSDYVMQEVYFVPPQTICVSRAISVKQDKYRIIEFEELQKFHKRVLGPNSWVPDFYTEYTDSTFMTPNSYRFYIHDYSSGITVVDTEGRVIFKGGVRRRPRQ